MTVLKTESKSRSDVIAYSADAVFAVTSFTPSSPFNTALPAGSCVDAAGALVTNASTACTVLVDACAAGDTSAIVADKLVAIRSASLSAADAAGLTKAKALIAADPFKRLV